MKKLIIVILLLSVTITAKPVDVYACSCVNIQDYVEDMSIVVGKVVQQRNKMFVLEVEKFYNANFNDTIVVYVDNFYSAACGYEFTVGETYYLFAIAGDGSSNIVESLKASLCTTLMEKHVTPELLEHVDNWEYPKTEAKISLINPYRLPVGLPLEYVINLWAMYLVPTVLITVFTIYYFKKKK